MLETHYDVVVVGAGLAGLTLTRQLLLETDKRVLLIDRRQTVPSSRQKVGESTVQLGGYYYSRVLDLEEHLFCHHLMKYNLRFYWKNTEADGTRFEDYSQASIRRFSNIASYQIDRNVFETELLRLVREDPRCTCRLHALRLDIDLVEAGNHRVEFRCGDEKESVRASWVVDATGRNRVLAKKLGLRQENEVRHGSFFWWVEGLVDIERLTDLSYPEICRKKDRRHQGHSPTWLATNQFCDEGLWFWVIPLHGKTSLGLVFDRDVVDFDFKDVASVEKATRWVCERFPLFARDLPERKVLDYGGFKDYSYSCAQTIDASRWAMTGDAGRFSDPLYSPGSDLIAIHNTLIVDAIESDDESLKSKCEQHEQLMHAFYQAYIPSYATSYDALGDAEVFSIKYTWELTIYFAGYVFPFINRLFADRRFVLSFLRLFARLGPINQNIQEFLSHYYRWKTQTGGTSTKQTWHDFMALGPLSEAEKTFYEVGVSVDAAKEVLTRQVQNLEEFARFIVAYVASRVVEDQSVLTRRSFVESIDIYDLRFDAGAIEDQVARSVDDGKMYSWSFDPTALETYRSPARMQVSVSSQH